MGQPSIYDENGLLYVLVEMLPSQEEKSYDEEDSYPEEDSYEVEEREPQPLGFGFSRIPATGELLQVGGNFWVVRQVIHYDMSPEKVEQSLKAQGKVFVATLQVDYYGVV
ncbi:MAG TPA: hypothetical protein V6D14_20490 [Coleofasciculaceae cyanobacterium]|jgi:hypothetical protein